MGHPVELILALLAVAVALGVLARQIGIPYPILLVIGGLLLALQPWTPPIAFDPQVVFLLFLPPLLYAGAFRTEWPEFRSQLRAITLLAVGLVLFTTTLVAAAAHYGLGLGWPAGFVLGALVSPPDAVAAMAVLQRVKVPQAVVTVLEGESLVNDAAALVTLRVAVGAVAATTAFEPWDACGDFALAAAGGLLLGVAGGWAAVRLHNWLDRRALADTKLTITVTLLTPYAVYLPAEHLHLSGVLAVVAAGLWVGTRCEQVFRRELYEEARAVWEWVEFLLNSLIFILIGLLLKTVLEQLDGGRSPLDLTLAAAGISLVVIVARLVWVFPGAYVPRWLDRVVLGADPKYPPWRGVVVVGWTGMRGVVSLAAALALPAFKDRDLVQFLTFWVIFATLVGQGLTLPLVIRGLGLGRTSADNPLAHATTAGHNRATDDEDGPAEGEGDGDRAACGRGV